MSLLFHRYLHDHKKEYINSSCDIIISARVYQNSWHNAINISKKVQDGLGLRSQKPDLRGIRFHSFDADFSDFLHIHAEHPAAFLD